MIRISIFIWLLFPTNALVADSPAEKLLKKPDQWYFSDEGKQTLENVISWQTRFGDWPKNTDTTRTKFSGQPSQKPQGTFDNGATTGELRLLAKAFRLTKNKSYREAFLLGLDHTMKAQYANGGWPQYFPLSKNYHRHITFNDGSMIRLMRFLRDVSDTKEFDFLDEARRKAAGKAVTRGIQCILNCQVTVDKTLTVWCAQHHAETLVPVRARSYEHPSLSGGESAEILVFLMSIKNPTPREIQAVKAGVAWFESSKIEGFRYQRSATQRALVKDAKASPLWARFYEIDSNRPIFSDRDGVIKYDVEQIGKERRQGYTWYGTWGSKAIQRYNDWPYR